MVPRQNPLMSGKAAILGANVRNMTLTWGPSKPETYDRPHVSQDVTIQDVSGEEGKYTLDSHGFQIYKHESKEKAFLDDEQLKAEYYPETEQLLKDA